MNAAMSSWPARMGVRTGGRPSFAAIAEEHLDAVYRYLLLMTRDRAVAEDLTGDTFEKAFRSWRRFDPRRASPRTWLFTRSPFSLRGPQPKHAPFGA